MDFGTFLPRANGISFSQFQPGRNGAETKQDFPDPEGRKDIQAMLVMRLVAFQTGTDASDIMCPGRGKANTARARQIIAYLLHTGLSMSLSRIAEFFSRDRTTIGHACRLVEDLRDGSKFDSYLSELETMVDLVRELADHEM